MDEYNFKKFTAVGGKFVVSVTLAKPGGLSFSSGFYNKYKIERFNAVRLYFDEPRKTIAIKFLREYKEGTFKLKARENSKGGYASAISFIKSYNLENHLGKKITPKVYNDKEIGRLFLLKINE